MHGAPEGASLAALEHADLGAINRWLSVTRLRAAAAIALAVPLIGLAGGLDFPVSKIVLVCAAVAALSLVYRRWIERGVDLHWIVYAQLVADTLGIAVGLAALGAHHLLFRGLFLMTIVPATMVSGTCGAVITVLSILCHGVLVLTTQSGALAVAEASPASLFLISAFLFALIANQSFFYKRHLREKNRELTVADVQLRETNRELAATAARALALLEVSRALDASLDLEVVTARLHGVVIEHLRTEWCATVLVDPAAPSGFRLVASRGLAAAGVLAADFADLGARVTAEGVVEIDAAGGAPALAVLAEWGAAAGLFAAMRCGTHTVGVFATGYRTQARPFDAFQREMVAGIATHAAVAIENGALHAKQREEAEVSAALLTVAELLNSDLDAEGRFERLTAHSCALVGCDFTNLMLYDARAGVFRVTAATDVHHPQLAEEVRHLALATRDFPVLAEVARGVWAERWEGDGRDSIPAHWLRHWALRSVLGVPLVLRGEVIGALVVGSHRHPGPFAARTRRLLAGIAYQTLTALENQHLIHTLRSANRLKSEFIGTMSHELRTPLNVIMGYTELLRDGEFGAIASAQREVLGRVFDASSQLLELIQATLDVNRMESGVLPLTLGPVDLRVLLDEVVSQLPAGWSKAGVRLSCDVAPEVPILQTDARKLKTVIRNLVHNALKFTEAGAVRVHAAPGAPPHGVAITVSDTGIGISPESQAIIFEMFRQVDGSDRRRHDGVGLGLYIARQLTGALGGTIEVESEVGHGAHFRVSLPVRSGSDVVMPIAAAAPASA